GARRAASRWHRRTSSRCSAPAPPTPTSCPRAERTRSRRPRRDSEGPRSVRGPGGVVADAVGDAAAEQLDPCDPLLPGPRPGPGWSRPVAAGRWSLPQAVVERAGGATVVGAGRAAVGVAPDVVDLAALGRDVAGGAQRAAAVDDLDRPPGRADEAAGPADVEDAGGSVHDDPLDD